MSSNIPPKLRETARQTYYTKGEVETKVTPARFKSHIAEPGPAAFILQRNPSEFQDSQIKPKAPFIRTGGYTPGLYAGRSEESKNETTFPVSSLSEAKLFKAKEYSE